MASTTKTPVMVLQELTVRHCKSAPEYSIIFAKEGTHNNEFHMQVVLDDVTALGLGRSKQFAKHDAAQKALDKLEEMGIYHPGQTLVRAPGVENHSPVKLAVNAVGVLADLCVENKIPFPTFTGISEVGPPHCKEFTYQCSISSIITTATAGTKKQAKQMAAKDMMDRIVQVLPDIVAEFNESGVAALVEDEEAAKEAYLKFNKPRPNLSTKCRDYPSNIKENLTQNEVNLDEIMEFFTPPLSEENLRLLIERLSLQMNIEVLQDEPLVVTLRLNTETSFVAIGVGCSFQEASEKAVAKAFEYLQLFIT